MNDLAILLHPPRATPRWWRLVSLYPIGVAGAVLCVLILAAAVLAPWMTPYDPIGVNLEEKLLPPSRAHWFGTDEAGRDLLTRVIYGARYSLLIAVGIVLSSALFGTLLGGVAGLSGGRLDSILMRITDVAMSFPYFIPALVIAMILGPSTRSLIIALAVVWWPSYVRIVRGRVLEIRHELFVEAARALGATSSRVLLKHVLPQCSRPIQVKISTDLGHALIAATSLSFIGLGVQPPLPEWGNLIAVARLYALEAWWYAVFPGIVVTVTVLAMTTVADMMIRFVDPIARVG